MSGSRPSPVDAGTARAASSVFASAPPNQPFAAPTPTIATMAAIVAPTIELEHRGLRDGFRRSRELVRGRFWIVLAVVGTLEIATEAAVSGLAAGIGSMLGESFFADWLGEAFGDVITNPPYAVVLVMMALELMREKPAEGAGAR